MEEEDDDTKTIEGEVTSHSVVNSTSTRVKARVTSYTTTSTQKSNFSSLKSMAQSTHEDVSPFQAMEQNMSKSQVSSTFRSESTSSLAESLSEKVSIAERLSKSFSKMSSQFEEGTRVIPTCQIITHQASNESEESAECTWETDQDGNKTSKTFYEESSGGQQQTSTYKEQEGRSSASRFSEHRFSAKLGLFSRSGTSSSSQEEYEPEIKLFGQKKTMSSGQFLTTGRVETTKSMESLRTSKESSSNQLSVSSEKTLHSHRGSFLTSSERDVRSGLTASHENRSFESYDRDIRLKRRAISGEEMGGSLNRDDGQITAERRRGLFAGIERKSTPQHLSLPPHGGPFMGMGTSQDSTRKLMILSPHSPLTTPDLLNFCQPILTIKGRRKKGLVLPKLILPRSDSEASEVFFEHSYR